MEACVDCGRSVETVLDRCDRCLTTHIETLARERASRRILLFGLMLLGAAAVGTGLVTYLFL